MSDSVQQQSTILSLNVKQHQINQTKTMVYGQTFIVAIITTTIAELIHHDHPIAKNKRTFDYRINFQNRDTIF